MIIGDTMGKQNIIEFGLGKMSTDYKRGFFYQLDAQLKRIHQSGGIVRNFSPQSVYIDEETRIPSFQAIYPNSQYFFDSDDQKRAQVEDVELLSTLALCVYLAGEEAEYNLENGLLQFDVLKNNIDFVTTYFPEEDLDYYKQVFSDSDVPIYYSDFIDQKMRTSSSFGNSRSLVRSTEAGKAMAQRNQEAAYVNYVLMFTVVAVLTILSIFFYFSYVVH